MIKKIYFAVLAVAMTMLASCNTEGDDRSYMQGVFTIQHSNNLTLWMDGGPIVRPTALSAQTLRNNKDFDKIERAYFVALYDPALVTEVDGVKVYNEVEIAQGNGIKTSDFMTPAQAQQKNILASDSIFVFDALNEENGIWFYKGYLTVSFQSSYFTRDNKAILPTVSAVYTVKEDDPSVINVDLLLNKHSLTKNDNVGGIASLFSCVSLRALRTYTMEASAPQEFTFNVSYKMKEGTKTVTRKVKRADFYNPF